MDVSPTIIVQMRQKYEDFHGVQFSVMDIRDLSDFSDNMFSLVFEKGCTDAVFCSTNFLGDSRQAYKEIFRVLQPEGAFISISHAPPPARVPFLRISPWSIDTCSVPYGESIHMYIMTKVKNTNEIKAIEGAEAVVLAKSTNVRTSLDQQGANKASTTKNALNAGLVTVTASVDILSELVNETEEVDS